MDIETQRADSAHNEEAVMEVVETIKSFLGDMGLEDAVIRLAVKKSNLNQEEAVNMLFEPDRVQDLIDELQRQEEKENRNDIVIVEEPAEAAP